MTAAATCRDPGRLELLRGRDDVNAIDHLHVVDGPDVPDALRQRVLLVRLLHPVATGLVDDTEATIRGGVRIVDPVVTWTTRLADLDLATMEPSLGADERTWLEDLASARAASADRWLVVRVPEGGDRSTYTLTLAHGDGPPSGFDPVLHQIDFSFAVACASPYDCRHEPRCPRPAEPSPELDYLTRDFDGFRTLMFDRLSLLAPDEASDAPAELATTLVELLAYAADRVAYAQDAAATEAYLTTARLRPSVRRHARLLDYRMHDGCNARAVVQVRVRDDTDLPGATLQARSAPDAADWQPGALLGTRVAGLAPTVPVTDRDQLWAAGSVGFEVVATPGRFHSDHDTIAFHTWGDADCCLPTGATTVDVVDPGGLSLDQGDLLVLEQTLGLGTLRPEDADPNARHVVRLAEVGPVVTDPLFEDADGDPLRIRRLAWHEADALSTPFTLTVGDRPVAVARGNLALVDHGVTVADEPLDLVPWGVFGRRRAVLAAGNVTFAAGDRHHGTAPAASLLGPDPRTALPEARLHSADGPWTPVPDLVGAAADTQGFVVEPDAQGRATLRFGDDRTGRQPPDGDMAATYRVGNGTIGNVGADVVAHLVTDPATVDPALAARVVGLRNPLPATGGVDPEPLADVRRDAPQAFRTQERAVTVDDWIEVTERHPQVQRAVARQDWTGSWHTMSVTADPVAGVDSATLDVELATFLAPFRLAGTDLRVLAPTYVPIDIVMTVCVVDDRVLGEVADQVRDELSSRVLTDGRRGLFHHDEVTFGESVWASQVVERAMAVPGVRWVDLDPARGNRFARRGVPQGSEVADGRIPIGPAEIPRCDSDPAHPEHGAVELLLEGGR